MMRKKLLLGKKISLMIYTIFFVNGAIYSQNKVILSNKTRICGWNQNTKLNELYEWEVDPDDAAKKYVNQICDIQHIQSKITVKKANVENAISIVDENGKRIIYYSSSFFQSSENEWFKIAILAHEIGHLINYHNFSTDSRLSDELIADEYSGFILAQLKAPFEEIKKLIETRCETKGDDDYPPRSARLESIQIGYEKGKKLLPPAPIEDWKIKYALNEVNCSDFYKTNALKNFEFDDTPFVKLMNEIEIFGVDNGSLKVAPESFYFNNLTNENVKNYELDFQLKFNYNTDRFSSNIDSEQYLIWNARINNNLIKGYYLSPICKNHLTYFEIGYIDGDGKVIIGELMSKIIGLFLDDKFITFKIRVFENDLYLFVNNEFSGTINLGHYGIGNQFAVKNTSPLKENSRGEIFSDQLSIGNTIELNYLRLNSLNKK